MFLEQLLAVQFYCKFYNRILAYLLPLTYCKIDRENSKLLRNSELSPRAAAADDDNDAWKLGDATRYKTFSWQPASISSEFGRHHAV
jgi:hypothetical protein